MNIKLLWPSLVKTGLWSLVAKESPLKKVTTMPLFKENLIWSNRYMNYYPPTQYLFFVVPPGECFWAKLWRFFVFFSCEELEAVYYIRGFWQRLMASHYCPNYFSYVSSSGNEVHRLRRQHRTDLVTNSILFSWLYTIKVCVSCSKKYTWCHESP